MFEGEPDLAQRKAVAEGVGEVVLNPMAAVQENYESLFSSLFARLQLFVQVNEDFGVFRIAQVVVVA